MLCPCCADWEFRTSPHVYLLCLLCKNVSWSVNECCAINEYMEPWAMVLEISKNQFDAEPSFSKKSAHLLENFTNLELVLNFFQTSMCNSERVMDWVMSLSMLVIWHNSLDGSIELMGYGTQKSMSYEIRTPNNKERAKSIGRYENVRRQQDTWYMTSEPSFFCSTSDCVGSSYNIYIYIAQEEIWLDYLHCI